jgi:two-component system, OmpR family, response regulator
MGDPLKKKILLVDDDFDFRFQQKTGLEAAGFEVIEAEGETEAATVLSEQTFDMAIVDLMMEQSDGGFTLCYTMKRDFPDMPVILVSGVNSEHGFNFDASSNAERSWIKADAFLAKPLRFEQLMFEVKRLLGIEEDSH